jgi:hypothetical protein
VVRSEQKRQRGSTDDGSNIAGPLEVREIAVHEEYCKAEVKRDAQQTTVSGSDRMQVSTIYSAKEFRVLFRLTSWIVLLPKRNNVDPRSDNKPTLTETVLQSGGLDY